MQVVAAIIHTNSLKFALPTARPVLKYGKYEFAISKGWCGKRPFSMVIQISSTL